MNWRAFTVPVEGATLSGELRGEGPPLILAHGMAGERHDSDRLVAALPAKLPLLRYDLRGFGQSQAGPGLPYSHTDDLLALFDALDIHCAPLLGLSMGGGVALNFALSHPERVSKLILISPAMIGWEWSDEWKTLWRGVSRAARDGDLALARELWWRHPMFAVIRETEAGVELRHSIDAYHGRQWFADSQREELPDVDRLHTLAMPTLLLTGEHDVSDIRLIADVIEAAAPDVTRIDYADAGHMLHMERAAEVTEAVTRFLA
jgi:pimeloyl-ACP methyl ester carboxylesterase